MLTASLGFLFLSSVCHAKASPGVVSPAVGRLSVQNGFGGFDDSGREVGAGLLRGDGGAVDGLSSGLIFQHTDWQEGTSKQRDWSAHPGLSRLCDVGLVPQLFGSRLGVIQVRATCGKCYD